MSKTFSEGLPEHILFGDTIDPDFKSAICQVLNKYHLPDSKSIAINTETGEWKLLEPGDEIPEHMTAIPPFSQMIKAFPNICFYSVSSIIKAMKILNPEIDTEETRVKSSSIIAKPVKKFTIRKRKSKRKK